MTEQIWGYDVIGQTISHYRIIEQLGRGGMGVVYKAEDTRLRRIVALKFLQSSGFDDSNYKARLIREARVAAQLDHRNICTVYEIDENDDGIFIAMAYVDGVDLRRKIQNDGPLEPDEAIGVAIQIARGLEAAHRKGVVHRDVKSANIMLTRDGEALLMDFGLALVLGGAKITRPNMVAGTAAYMSPEQLRGEVVDERTDIWSLGICMYEMLAGEPPFSADYDTALAYAILNEDPPPLSARRAGVPFSLELIIEGSIAKDRETRYRDMAGMRAELEALLAERTGKDTGETDADTAPSIAVLPFADLSEEKDQEYFCDGIADEIINDLVQLERLRVVSRTSSFVFKGTSEDIRAIGRKLGVKSVLEGSVRKTESGVRVTAQLVNVSDGSPLWSDYYDRELRDIFEIQEEIGQSIVGALELELSDRERRALHKPVTHDVEAYDYYLRGRRFFYQTKRSNLAKARDLFTQAIRKDSKFARAYAGMADCHSYLYWYFDHTQENLDRAMASSRKALDLDPDLAEAHAARGLALTLGKRYEDAENEYRDALRLNPNLFEAYYFYARTRFVQGDMEGAARLFEKACDASPDDHQAPVMLGFVLKTLCQDDRAAAVYRRGIKNIEKHLQLNREDSRALYLGSGALIDLGKREKALQYSMRAVSLDPDDSYILYGMACNYCRLGEIDEAIYYFTRALNSGFAHKEWIDNDSDLDPLRDDPRFIELVGKLK